MLEKLRAFVVQQMSAACAKDVGKRRNSEKPAGSHCNEIIRNLHSQHLGKCFQLRLTLRASKSSCHAKVQWPRAKLVHSRLPGCAAPRSSSRLQVSIDKTS